MYLGARQVWADPPKSLEEAAESVGAQPILRGVGDIVPQRLGEELTSIITEFDNNGNLVSTVDIGQYYATLASWFGIHPGDVLATGRDACGRTCPTNARP